MVDVNVRQRLNIQFRNPNCSVSVFPSNRMIQATATRFAPGARRLGWASLKSLAIKEGDKLPTVVFKTRANGQWKDVSTDDVFKGKRIALFGLPGACNYFLYVINMLGFEV